MTQGTEPRKLPKRLVLFAATLGILAGCEEGPKLGFLQPKDDDKTTEASGQSTQLIERDVEAPEVFEVTEAGLWDGRPSLGGVWVAHSDVTEPERVIIRNNSNGKFVIGALFRREREIPGPRIQASSDAAAALGMLAGAPVELHVTALRREAVEEAPEVEATEVAAVEPGAEISEATLDPIAGAAAAIDATAPASAEAPVVTAAASAADAAPAPAPKPKSSSLSKPYIQIGIFSVEANAKRTADQMRNAGMVPTVLAQKSNGKPFWRVVVGPAQTKSERTALLKQVKETGFSDAYAVTN
ncbi:Sporulation related domain protein [Falsiruegeria litorea R37]|uniref:Sporulation related domain protein n=1 Tax=Falsiruegeria litorea R37 TaxID=1200284 RepID=A0A1Y5SZG9_9RHOB|nr:SPOR domain-containing protein [Falsiruegeria litorea]SLN48612.1 Sporulation related domain protein [Falsiruegeria litorea R37]